MAEPILRSSVDNDPERKAYSRAFILIGLMALLIATIAEVRGGFKFHREHATLFSFLLATGLGFLLAGVMRLGSAIDSAIELREQTIFFRRRFGLKPQEIDYSQVTRVLATEGMGLFIGFRPAQEWLPEQSFFLQIHNAPDRDVILNEILQRSASAKLEGLPLVPFPVNVSDRRPLLAYLVVDVGGRAGQSYYPIRDQLTIGREPAEGNLGFPKEAKMSRNHFRFSINGKDIRVTDLASTNRTYFNSQPLEAGVGMIVSDGDQIQAGGRTFEVSILEEKRSYWTTGLVAAGLALAALMISESTFRITLGFAFEYAPIGAVFWGLGIPAFAAAMFWVFFRSKSPIQRAFLVAGAFLVLPAMAFLAEMPKRKPILAATASAFGVADDPRWGFPRGFLFNAAFDGGLPLLHISPTAIDRYAFLLWRDSQRVAAVDLLFDGDFAPVCQMRSSGSNDLGDCFLYVQDILLASSRIRTESGRMALTDVARFLSKSGRVGDEWVSSIFFVRAALRHIAAVPRTFEPSLLDLRPAISTYSEEQLLQSEEAQAVVVQEDRGARGLVGALHAEVLENVTHVELRSGQGALADEARGLRVEWMKQMSRRMTDESEVRAEISEADAESLARRIVQVFGRLDGPVNRRAIEWDTRDPGHGFSHRIYSRILRRR